MNNKYRYEIQIRYGGKWRSLWGSDKRYELSEYMEKCPVTVEMRIVDLTEEEEERHDRRH